MYRFEEYKTKIGVEDYLENYVDVPGFLECCRQCGSYGQLWSCPPFAFDPGEYWRKYRFLHIIGTKIIFDRPLIEKETSEAETKTGAFIRQVFSKEKRALLDKLYALEKQYPGGIGLSAGDCNICGQCARTAGEACRYPDRLRYSIEALGGNVVKTAEELLGIKLKWTAGKMPEYLTLVNGFLTNDPDAEI